MSANGDDRSMIDRLWPLERQQRASRVAAPPPVPSPPPPRQADANIMTSPPSAAVPSRMGPSAPLAPSAQSVQSGGKRSSAWKWVVGVSALSVGVFLINLLRLSGVEKDESSDGSGRKTSIVLQGVGMAVAILVFGLIGTKLIFKW